MSFKLCYWLINEEPIVPCTPKTVALALTGVFLYGATMFTAYPMGHSSQKQLSNAMSSQSALNSQHAKGSLCKGRLETSATCELVYTVLQHKVNHFWKQLYECAYN